MIKGPIHFDTRRNQMRKLLSVLLALALMLAGAGAGNALAGAYETSFVTSITYQNISSFDADNVVLLFYSDPTDDTPVVLNRPSLAAGAGTSIYIGGVGDLPAGFRGTAIMTSDQEMAATLVQVPDGTTVKARPLSNGFSSGTPQTLIASFYKDPALKTILSVQNAGTADASVTLKFYALGAATPTYQTTQTLKSGTGYIVDAGTSSLISGATFNGSVLIETSGASDQIVSSALELDSGSGIGAKAFQGIGEGKTLFYLPTALCVVGGPTTYYAVQNTSTTQAADVTVTYSPSGTSESVTIPAGNKRSFNTCTVNVHNFSGSARVQSTNGVNVIAIGKVSGGGLATAFEGVGTGYPKLSLPYVRYANTTQWNSGLQRTFIAIQNLGPEIPANQITVKYINPDGSVAGTHTINTATPQFAKQNSNATNAGLTTFGFAGGVSGGSVIIEGPAGSQLAAIARVTTRNGSLQAGEDYNAIPFP
jgi:hypothetical protein